MFPSITEVLSIIINEIIHIAVTVTSESSRKAMCFTQTAEVRNARLVLTGRMILSSVPKREEKISPVPFE